MEKKYFMGLLLVSGISMHAQFGALDHSLNPGTGADNLIQVVALQQDEKIIIGGDFLSYDGNTKKRLARLNTDGSIDPTFNIGSGANKLILDAVIQPDSKVIVTGEFTIFNNTSKKRIARLNQDGSIDNTFNIGYGANNIITNCLLQPDGKILIGGIFTSFNWIARNGIARLNADGSLDTTFDYDGDPMEVIDIEMQPNGQYIVNATNKLIRLNADGSTDTSFYSGSGTDYPIQTILIQNDGKILIGGYFTSYDGFAINRIVRLESNGIIDTTFNYGIAADYGVLAISEQPDGKIIISGLFSKYNDIPREKIARLYPDGTLDESFDPALGPDNIVLNHSIQPDGRILIAGDFNGYNGVARNKIARISGYNMLSTPENVVGQLNLWPNPVTNLLHIVFPETGYTTSVTIHDLHGKTLLESSTSESIDVSKLSSGVYIVSVTTNNGKYISRFIKQ
ncbi:MAG TPA: T9SS type A sorting domain-containing protein [Flavobacterium sp.]|jgi:uncharacterized delta-60 repeat protein